MINRVFPDMPVMHRVAKGESGYQQWYPDGSLVTGRVDPDDKGLFQINARYWGEDAERLGLDYENNIIDNVLMARYVMDTQGITAWVYYNNHLASN